MQNDFDAFISLEMATLLKKGVLLKKNWLSKPFLGDPTFNKCSSDNK